MTDTSCAGIELSQELLEGLQISATWTVPRAIFCSVSRKTCVSVINAVRRVSLSEPISVLWADDRTYAGYLTSTFELSWAQSVPAAHWIKELLEERPRAVGG